MKFATFTSRMIAEATGTPIPVRPVWYHRWPKAPKIFPRIRAVAPLLKLTAIKWY